MFGLLVKNIDPLAFFTGDFFEVCGDFFLFSAGERFTAADTTVLGNKPSLDGCNDIFKHDALRHPESASWRIEGSPPLTDSLRDPSAYASG